MIDPVFYAWTSLNLKAPFPLKQIGVPHGNRGHRDVGNKPFEFRYLPLSGKLS